MRSNFSMFVNFPCKWNETGLLVGLRAKLSLVSVTGGDECEVSMKWKICVTDDNRCFAAAS